MNDSHDLFVKSTAQVYDQLNAHWTSRATQTSGSSYTSSSGSSSDGGTSTPNPRDNQTADVTISMSDYDTNSAGGVIVVGTAGNDKFTNHSANVTISGGAGNDSIYNNYNYVSISGGTGDDTIKNFGLHTVHMTIYGGKGDDSIDMDGQLYHGHNVLQYANGDGDDTVDGWLSNSTLCVEGSYTRATVGSDAVIYVGNGSITFTGQGRQYSSEINVETVPAGTFSQHPTPCIRLRPQRQAAVRTLRQRAVRLRRLMQIPSSTRAVIKVYGITQENP